MQIFHFTFQLQSFEMKYNDLQQEAITAQDRNRQGLQELSAKEEELVVVKVELSALQEKYKARCNDVSPYFLVIKYYVWYKKDAYVYCFSKKNQNLSA